MIKKKRNNEFIEKLVDMLISHPQAICWSSPGTAIIIQNKDVLSTQVLPKYFRHRNYDSFIRQLNMYRFKKSIENGVENYRNDYFYLGNESNFYQIQREHNIKARQKAKAFKMSQNYKIDCAMHDLVNKLISFQYLSKRRTQNMKMIIENMATELQRIKSKKVKSSIISLHQYVEEIQFHIRDVQKKYDLFLADCFGDKQIPTHAIIENQDRSNFFIQRQEMEQLLRPCYQVNSQISKNQLEQSEENFLQEDL